MSTYHFYYTTRTGGIHQLTIPARDFQEAMDKLYRHCPGAQIIQMERR